MYRKTMEKTVSCGTATGWMVRGKTCHKASGQSPHLSYTTGRYKQLLRLHAHSKKIILESVHNDTHFLASCNVMDYSLLVGVNDDRKELIVGIVDFIGPYTWYKTLETRAKTTLNAAVRGGKGVTVLPPGMYGDRFRKAMEQNFLMVPGEWDVLGVKSYVRGSPLHDLCDR